MERASPLPVESPGPSSTPTTAPADLLISAFVSGLRTAASQDAKHSIARFYARELSHLSESQSRGCRLLLELRFGRVPGLFNLWRQRPGRRHRWWAYGGSRGTRVEYERNAPARQIAAPGNSTAPAPFHPGP
jgi:hypothetical protein